MGLALNKETGDLWVSTNERDGLGDDLVPDYITRVKEGHIMAGLGTIWVTTKTPGTRASVPISWRDHRAGQRAGAGTTSASLEMTFYTITSSTSAFPSEYWGDAFAAFTWNRNSRTGYKVVRVRLNHGVPTGEYDDFLTGFVVDGRSVWEGRWAWRSRMTGPCSSLRTAMANPMVPSRARQVVVSFALTLAIITYIDRVCISQAMPSIQAEFGLTDRQVGWVFSAFTLAYALFEIPFGWLGDKIGARLVVVRIVAMWSIFTLCTGAARAGM